MAPDVLDRAFAATAPNQQWAAGLTYVGTLEGWLCVAVVRDLFSRWIVGWAVNSTHIGDTYERLLRAVGITGSMRWSGDV